MIELRPHTLRYAIISGGYKDPATGDWIPGATTWSESVRCLFELNSQAIEAELPNGDGWVTKYAYTVYLDLDDTKDYLLGESIRLFDQRGLLVAEKQVQGFRRGQLNRLLWL